MVTNAESKAAREARWMAAVGNIPAQPIALRLTVEAALALTGSLQLALRHPQFARLPTATLVRGLVAGLIDRLCARAPDAAVVREALEAGNCREHDHVPPMPGFCGYCQQQICDNARDPELAAAGSRAHVAKCPKHPVGGLIRAAERTANYLSRLQLAHDGDLDRGECQAAIDELLAGIAGCSGEA